MLPVRKAVATVFVAMSYDLVALFPPVYQPYRAFVAQPFTFSGSWLASPLWCAYFQLRRCISKEGGCLFIGP